MEKNCYVNVGSPWLRTMKVSSLKNIPAKVITALAIITTVFAIVGGIFMFEDRYARADDLQKTQENFVKSIKLININLELICLKNEKSELKREKRELVLKVHEAPNDVYFINILDEVKDDLTSVCGRITALENKIIVK